MPSSTGLLLSTASFLFLNHASFPVVAQKSEVFGGKREKRKLELFSISWLYWNGLSPERQSLISIKTYRNGFKKSNPSALRPKAFGRVDAKALGATEWSK